MIVHCVCFCVATNTSRLFLCCSAEVTKKTGAVVDGVLAKWPDTEKKVNGWKRDVFCDMVMKVATPEHEHYRSICGLAAVADKDAPWTTFKFYIMRINGAPPSDKEEAE